MDRLFALFAALALTTVTVSSACTAAAPSPLNFTLERSGNSDRIHARFRKTGEGHHNWSSSFPAGELLGLDLARFRAPGTVPLSFALIRDAGRIDCAGSGGNSLARGTCRVTPDRAFLGLLARRGIGRPNDEQAFGLIAVNAKRELVESLAAARYPTPSVEQLMSLAAVGVTDRYIGELARAGYRPADLDGLLQFKALNITPEFIQGFVRMGYSALPASELVQLKALGVTPDYVAGFQRLGYRRLPVSKIVEMKALGVTPDFIRSMQQDSGDLPTHPERGSDLSRRR